MQLLGRKQTAPNHDMSDTAGVWNTASQEKPRCFEWTHRTHLARTRTLRSNRSSDQFAGSDFRAQVTQCFENVRTALWEASAGFEHIVKITNYFTDMSDLPIFIEARDRYVNTKAPPASTAVQVARLALPQAVFELETIAMVPVA